MFLPIQKSDIQKCASLYSQFFSSPPWSEPWTDEEADNRLRYLMDSKGFFGFLAEKDGKTIGFVLGTTEPFVGGNAFYLREMCVCPTEQGRGIGKELIAYLHTALVSLDVSRSYLITQRGGHAARFYEKNGYIQEVDDAVYQADLKE